MDATRSDACPTGMIMEVVNTGSQGAQLEPKSMPRHLHELINVPGDGNCLYHCLAELYKFTVRWPIGAQLRNRMQSVTAQYSPGRTFAPTAPFLRMLFLDFLRTALGPLLQQRSVQGLPAARGKKGHVQP